MRIEYDILELRTKHDFNIARASAPATRRNVWIRLIGEDGVEGWGEAAPNAYYHESADTVVAAIESIRRDLEAVPDHAYAQFDDICARLMPAAASLSAAIFTASLDQRGKREGTSLSKALAYPAREQYSSFTIGIDELDVMREKVQEARSYRILKIKVGTPNDERILAMLREERPDATIRVDANTGWTVQEALRNLKMLQDYQIELIEQPLPPDDLEGLRRITEVSPIPIIADESCKVAADVNKLSGCVHGVNIKLAKCGSLREASWIAQAARARKMSVMVGCMIESTLGIAAAMQIAPLCDYVDLDGAALLANDPFTGPHIAEDGRLVFVEEPGLGVGLRAG